jgi:hypothetical protein
MEDKMSMAPTIRIDDEVYTWLQKNARPFEDTPNSVLRRIAKLDTDPDLTRPTPKHRLVKRSEQFLGNRELTGKLLKKQWSIPAESVLYHKEGRFFENLKQFPGALCDPYGYVLFKTKEEYFTCPGVNIGKKTNVRPGISALPNYVPKG